MLTVKLRFKHCAGNMYDASLLAVDVHSWLILVGGPLEGSPLGLHALAFALSTALCLHAL